MLSISDWLSARYDEVKPFDFYRDLFPLGGLSTVEKEKGKYTAIAIEETEKDKVSKWLIHDDLEPIEEIISRDNFAVISPIAYCGKYQRLSNARELYAIVFDLDGIQTTKEGYPDGLDLLFTWIEGELKPLQEEWRIPKPTYIVSSGTGLHLYYFLDKPLRMYNYVIEPLRDFRYTMTNMIWRKDITNLWEHKQYESVSQCFRMVGSKTKVGTRVKAYKIGNKWSIEELNKFVPPHSQIPTEQPKSRLTLEQAKELFPDWYAKRIVEGIPRKTWVCNEGLYYWWIEQIKHGNVKNRPKFRGMGVQEGYRYNAMAALAIYAIKCGIPKKQMIKDGLKLVPLLDEKTSRSGNNFTNKEVYKAANAAYRVDYITVSRDAIETMTQLDIPPQKKNGRKQAKHLEYARGIKSVYRVMGELDKVGGRGSRYEELKAYLDNNSKAKLKEIKAALDVSVRTIERHKATLLQAYKDSGTPLGDIPAILLTPQERIEAALELEPEATNTRLAELTGLSRKTVIHYR